MKIVFITQDDPFYIKSMFDEFFEQCGDRHDVRAVVISQTMGKKMSKLVPQLWNFYGPVDFIRMGMRFATNKVLAATLGRMTSTAFNLEQLFAAHGIRIIRSQNVNGRKLREALSEIDFDLIVSVAAPQVFKRKLLELPEKGCINIHTARLPQYRGMMPNFWARLNGEKRSAITIHTMDVDLDRGHILLQREFDLDRSESLDHLIKRTKRLAAGHLLEVLDAIERGTAEPVPPPDVEESYYSFPTKEDVRRFRRQGNRLL
jgi:methionyl-tRNA formyltransferase